MERLSPKTKTVLLSLCLGFADFLGFFTGGIVFFALFILIAALMCYAILIRWRQRTPMFLASVAIQSAVLFVLIRLYMGSHGGEAERGQALLIGGYFFAVPVYLLTASAVIVILAKVISPSVFDADDDEEDDVQ